MSSELPDGSGAAPAGKPVTHHVSIEERGSFAYARCACGWRAPGRRARDRARRDGDNHLGTIAPA